MKQFGKIFKFELKNYLANKIFVGVTVFLVLIIAAAMFFPRIKASFSIDETTNESTDKKSVMLIVDSTDNSEAVKTAFAEAFTDYDVKITDDDLETVKD